MSFGWNATKANVGLASKNRQTPQRNRMLLKPRSGRFQTWNLILGIDRRVVLETLIKLATIGVNSVDGRKKLRLFRETSEEKPDAFVISKRKETARYIDKEVSIHNAESLVATTSLQRVLSLCCRMNIAVCFTLLTCGFSRLACCKTPM